MDLHGIINTDYILYLFQKGRSLCWDSFPMKGIELGEDIYDRIIELVDNEDTTVLDLQEAYKSLLPDGIVFWRPGYCFDNDEYDEVDYSAITEPRCLSKSEYRFLINKKRIEEEKDWYGLTGLKKWDLTQDQIKDRDDTVSCCIEEYAKDLKHSFARKVYRFIPAINYEEALRRLTESHPKVMFSHDYKGYSKDLWFKPAPGVELAPKTNFVFGASSYFTIVLKYKDVHILPYADIINYRIENTSQQIRFFKRYEPKRNEWLTVFRDTCSLFKEIQDNKDRFCEKYILGPLNDLMAQMKMITEAPDSDLEISEVFLEVNPRFFFETGHIDRRGQREFYKIFRLSNALFLLENLTLLNSSGIAKTDVYKDTILSMNRDLLPSISRFEKKIASAEEKIIKEIRSLKQSFKNDNEFKDRIDNLQIAASNLKVINRILVSRRDYLLRCEANLNK